MKKKLLTTRTIFKIFIFIVIKDIREKICDLNPSDKIVFDYIIEGESEQEIFCWRSGMRI